MVALKQNKLHIINKPKLSIRRGEGNALSAYPEYFREDYTHEINSSFILNF
jgi:hypothetical protein